MGAGPLNRGSPRPSIAPVRRLLIPFLLALPFVGCSGEQTPSDSAPANQKAGNQQAANEQAGDQQGGAGTGATPKSDATADAFAAGYDDSDCNLETVLDPNKPGAPGHLIASERNPNGDSELAVLMRRFVDDLRENQLLAKAGEPIKPMHDTHRMMRCAWPTVPSERDEGYDQRSQAYLAAVRAFEASPNQQTYEGIVSNCVACHQVSCSGVIDFIEGLRWQ